jgi:hypothetical protein
MAEGIETLVLKGPVLAEWLYSGEIGTHSESDLTGVTVVLDLGSGLY